MRSSGVVRVRADVAYLRRYPDRRSETSRSPMLVRVQPFSRPARTLVARPSSRSRRPPLLTCHWSVSRRSARSALAPRLLEHLQRSRGPSEPRGNRAREVRTAGPARHRDQWPPERNRRLQAGLRTRHARVYRLRAPPHSPARTSTGEARHRWTSSQPQRHGGYSRLVSRPGSFVPPPWLENRTRPHGSQTLVNCPFDERLTSCPRSRRAGALAPALTCIFVGGGGRI